MRILFLPQCFPPVRGGGEWHAWRLSTALAGQGATVRVVTSNLMRVIARGGHKASAFQPASECVDGVDGVDIRRHEYGTPLGRTLLRSPWTPFPLRRRARRRAYRRFVARFEAAVKGELHSFAPDVVLTMAHLQASVRVAFRLRAREAFPLAYVPLLHAEDAMAREPEMQRYLRAADVVITNTEFERAFVTGEHGVAPERVVRGGLGADLPASVEPLPPRHVLFVGRLDPDKGIGRLVDAMRRLWRDGLEWPLVLLGSRCHATHAIDGMLRRLPSADRARVAMREDVSDEARDRALREAACLVLPSRLESFGLVLLESWAQGVPVVTWDLPLYREIVTSGEDGLLARPDDTADLADRIRTVAADPELRSRLGRAGRIKVERDHAWSAVGGRVLEALERARTGPLRSAGLESGAGSPA